MVDINTMYERLEKAIALESDDAAIRMRARYAPQAGPDAKVFPPTYYLPPNNTCYHFEHRWTADGRDVEVVVLDAYQSQANRCEAALARQATKLGLPRIVLRDTVSARTIEISSLEAPHRSRDAYFRDSYLNGTPFDKTPIGKALDEATLDDLTAFLRYVPTDLVYGVWDSHRGKRIPLKFPRSYTSEMIGWEPLRGQRAATKGDPLNLPGGDQVPASEWRAVETAAKSKQEEKKLSELGHGMVPGAPDPTNGGVTVRGITRLGVLSLTAIAGLNFGGSNYERTGRVMVATLGLLGDRLAFGRAGLHLRSGCDLVLQDETLEWVQRGGATEPLSLSVEDARQLFDLAKERLEQAGIIWSAEPVVLAPIPRLHKVIESVLLERDVAYVAEED
ncbi:MAG TPA: type I-U CRISPR-associated RAMP protein Csb1/Cas7u [Chloroflexota bacterium]|nr:type I-U CRISPR-associated RAMP protein Csb1/Cas7u [Chloroflexota bacterium]